VRRGKLVRAEVKSQGLRLLEYLEYLAQQAAAALQCCRRSGCRIIPGPTNLEYRQPPSHPLQAPQQREDFEWWAAGRTIEYPNSRRRPPDESATIDD
jgi:hypothetical protein